MSLNFDFTEMKKRLGDEEYERISSDPLDRTKWHPVTNTLIWVSLSVGLSGITEKNAGKFWDRVCMLQAKGGLLASNKGDFFLTEQDIKNHIGMWTNVSNMTDTAFYASLARTSLEDGRYRARQQGVSAFDFSQKLIDEAKKEETAAS